MTANPTPADTLAQAIRRSAEDARSEEDLRVGVEGALSAIRQLLGLTATPEYEKTTLSGSADAVYGHVVIEYKRPGRLAEKDFPRRLAAAARFPSWPCGGSRIVGAYGRRVAGNPPLAGRIGLRE